MAWGLVEATGLGVFWWFGPLFVYGIMPALDTLDRQGLGQPARQRAQAPRGRPLLPLLHLRVHPAPVRLADRRLLVLGARRPQLPGEPGPGLHRRPGGRHRHQHRPRAGPQAPGDGEVAVQGGAGADRLRPLLHRAQPRPPRARGHARGPGQLAAWRELLALPAAHGVGQPDLGLAPGEGAARAAPGTAAVHAEERHPERLGHDAGAVRRPDRWSSARSCCRGWCSRRCTASRCWRS